MGVSGKRPIPASLINNSTYKKSQSDLDARIETEQALKTNAKLTCPKYLSEAAKKEWRRVIRLYKGLEVDILCDLDISALVIYCEAWAVYKKAQETWAKYTQVVAANPEAQRILDKCFALMEKQSKIINSISEQLCLTPVGRARMGIMNNRNAKDTSAIEDLMNEED